MPPWRGSAAPARLRGCVMSISRLNGCAAGWERTPRRWRISGSITVQCWSACWWIASPHWCEPAWRAWIVSPRTGCGCGPRRGRRRSGGIRPCRSAGARQKRAGPDLPTQFDTAPGAASRKQAAARRRAAEDRERRVRAALAVTEELHAKQQEAARKEAERAARKAPQDAAADAKGEAGEPASKKPREKEPRASTTDAQARVMKMADGGFRPAYNVQFATDTKSTAI